MNPDVPPYTSNPKAKSKIEWLISLLPPVLPNFQPTGFEAAAYGASLTIARELGLNQAPESLAGWTHYWYHQPLHDPRNLLIWDKPQYPVLVANSLLADFLQRKGYPYAVATGVPFIYQRPLGLPRQEGSLLVMPPHSSEQMDHQMETKAWIDYLLSLKNRFKTIVACVHRTCVGRFWTPALDEVEIPWVCGAHSLDMNSLIRMRTLFESFEYVNSSVIGSQVAYAAYAGARPSISGPDLQLPIGSYTEDEFYKKYPHLLVANQKANSREHVTKEYPFLCREPDEISDLTAWGAEMLGETSKRPYEEMGRLLGWRYDAEDPAYSGTDFANIASKIGWGDSDERKFSQAKEESIDRMKDEVDKRLSRISTDIAKTQADARYISWEMTRRVETKLDIIVGLIDIEVPMPSRLEIFRRSLGSSATQQKAKENQLAEDIIYLQNSDLFSADWYLTQCPDVAKAGTDPATHFIMNGEEEGRPASPFYHTQRHLSQARKYRKLPFTGSYFVQYLKLLEKQCPLVKALPRKGEQPWK